MSRIDRVVVAHGGAEAEESDADGPQRAAEAGMRVFRQGGGAVDAVTEAIRLLEEDERFNAGYGSDLRLDGMTIQMDAAVVDGDGRVGAVAAIEDVRHPILVARALLDTPHVLLAGPGATAFARRVGQDVFDPRSPKAEESFRKLADLIRARAHEPKDLEWDVADLRARWNYAGPPDVLEGPMRGRVEPTGASDTVGAVAFDGRTFAAGASTGGSMGVLLGRVGDTPLPGCGLDADGRGAVTVSGAGEHIVRARVAQRVLRRLEEGASAEEAAREAVLWIREDMPIAILVLDRRGRHAAEGRTPFPWGVSREPAGDWPSA